MERILPDVRHRFGDRQLAEAAASPERPLVHALQRVGKSHRLQRGERPHAADARERLAEHHVRHGGELRRPVPVVVHEHRLVELRRGNDEFLQGLRTIM